MIQIIETYRNISGVLEKAKSSNQVDYQNQPTPVLN